MTSPIPKTVILLNAYGVLNLGETEIPGAPQRVTALRRAGRRVTVVSNSAGYPKRVMMARYARLGFDFALEEVVSSREALLARLSGDPSRHWRLMLGLVHGREEFENLSSEFRADDAAAYDRAEGFLLVGSDA